ncbi:secreted protein/lipoprotein [Streptomyces clavifer]|uniref:secreted protein/lipoprotein n=1 Tax=Streptomyces clavifer TaxID=68188 RepID=UPI003663700C
MSKPSPSLDPAQSAEAAAVDAYKGYWRALETLYADSSGDTDQLKRVASGMAMVNADDDAKRARDRGHLIIGSVSVTDSTVTASDMGRKAPKAVLTSCLDITKWNVVLASTKKPLPLPSTRLTKYVITSTLEKWPQGWVVIEDTPQGKAC